MKYQYENEKLLPGGASDLSAHQPDNCLRLRHKAA